MNAQPTICPHCLAWMLRKIETHPEPDFEHALHCPHSLVLAAFVSKGRKLAALQTEWPVTRAQALEQIKRAGATVRPISEQEYLNS